MQANRRLQLDYDLLPSPKLPGVFEKRGQPGRERKFSITPVVQLSFAYDAGPCGNDQLAPRT